MFRVDSHRAVSLASRASFVNRIHSDAASDCGRHFPAAQACHALRAAVPKRRMSVRLGLSFPAKWDCCHDSRNTSITHPRTTVSPTAVSPLYRLSSACASTHARSTSPFMRQSELAARSQQGLWWDRITDGSTLFATRQVQAQAANYYQKANLELGDRSWIHCSPRTVLGGSSSEPWSHLHPRHHHRSREP